MVLFSIVGISVLLVIFLFVRSESINKQLSSMKIQYASVDKGNKYLAKQSLLLAEELQYTYLAQLEFAEKRNLVSGPRLVNLKAMVFCIKAVIEGTIKSETVQASLTRSLPASDSSMEDIQKMMMEQDSQLRMLWSKNTADGYLRLIRELLARAMSGNAQ